MNFNEFKLELSPLFTSTAFLKTLFITQAVFHHFSFQ